MANDKKFIVKRGLVAPNVDFANGSGTISATYLNSSNTLSFSGNTGQLFSITDSMSGTIFSVNDISGIPSIEVMDTGAVKIAETFGTVAIGANTSSGYKLYVNGNTLFGNSVTLNSTLIANGSVGTSGFVLTSNGTGVYWAAANSGISGVLTANNSNFLQGRTWATPFAIGSTTANSGAFTTLTASANVNIDSGVLFTDATTNRVGIGTITPVTTLHVLTPSAIQGRFAYDTNNYTDVSYDGFNTVGGSVLFRTSGTTRLRIDSGGSIGIANNAPAARLHVQGDTLVGGDGSITYDFKLQRLNNGIRAVQHDFAASSNSPWILHGENLTWTGERTGTVESTQAYRPYYEAFAPVVGYKEFGFANVTSGNFTGSNLIPNLVLKNDGNVGIGTTNPTARLEANGQVRINPSSGNYSLIFANAGTNEWEIGGDGARIAITEVGGAERFRIASGGNVGIGNTAPGQTLQVDGSVGIKNGLVANGSFGTSGHVLTSNGSAIYWAAANSGIASVLNANNSTYLQGRTWATPFAIGSTTANTGNFTALTATRASNETVYVNPKLVGYISIYPDPATSSGRWLILASYLTGASGLPQRRVQGYIDVVRGNVSSGNRPARIKIDLTAAYASGEVAEVELEYGPSSLATPKLYNVTYNGSTYYALDLYQISVSTTAIDASEAYFSGAFVDAASSNAVPFPFIVSHTTVSNIAELPVSNRVVNDIFSTSNGNIGISVSTPSAKLHVNGQIRIEHGGDKALDFVRAGTSTYSVEHDSSRIYFYNATNANTLIAMTNDNLVGIGAANPSYKLHVFGDIGGTSRIYLGSASNAGQLQLLYGATSQWALNSGTGGINNFNITDILNGVERLRIDASGNVAIGSTTAPAKLFVNGHMSVANGFGIYANGTLGTAGFVLTSNGSSLYWAAANSGITDVLNANNASYLGTFAAADYPRKAENAAITGGWNFSSIAAVWSGHSYTNTFDGTNVYQHIGQATGTDKIWNLRVFKADNNYSTFVFNGAGVATAGQSFRAPFFYDIDDTAFYANPASTSIFNTLNLRTINANNNIIQPSAIATSSLSALHLAYNPEGYMSDHPFLTNDLGSLRVRGGTFTANTNYNIAPWQIDALFDGTPSYCTIDSSNTAIFPIVLEFTLPKTLFYGSFVGISFGSSAWRTNTLKIEALSNNVWVTCVNTTSFADEQIVAPIPGNGAAGTTALRFTFANPNISSGSGFRINNIWAYDYSSNGWTNLAMPRAGGLMYSDLSVNGSITIASGRALIANGTAGTAGFVLTSNGTATYWSNASSISGTISNALTANNSNFLQGRTWQTPFAIGSTTANTGAFTSLTASANVNIDSGVLFTDATTNRVGINTTTPTVTLSANGEVSVGQRNKLTFIGLDINSGVTPNFIKIKTNIPTASTSADFTINIKGFRYGESSMCNLTIGWHYYLSQFYNVSASSSGAWAPTIRLSDESGFVCIVLSAPSYWPKLYVESMYSSAYNDDYAAGWTWVDEDATGSQIVTVPYKSDFGNQFVMTSAGNVGIGTSTPGQKFVVSNAGAGGVEIIPSGIIQSYNRSTSAYQAMYLDANEVLIRNGVNERMRVNSVGNVGIGNTAPGQRLQVDGSVGIKNGLVANGSFGSNGQVLTSNGSAIYWAADYANATNITSGTLAEPRLPFRMDQNVRTTDNVTFANLTITGSVIVTGNVTTWSANNLNITDNMIYLNSNSTIANPDIGISANYNDGTYRHTGIFRDATDGVWKVFDQYLPEPDASPYIDTANTSFRIADFQANVVNAASVVINNTQAYRQRDGTGTVRTLLTTLSDSSVLFNGYQGTPMMNGVNGATYLYGSGSGSIVMTLLSGGNVGIGNTSPTSRLQLNYATGDAGGIRLQQAGWAYSTRIGAVGTSGDQQYWSTNFNAATNAVDVAGQYTTYMLQHSGTGTVSFGTSNGAGFAPVERMRIFHNNIKATPNVATMSSQDIAFEVAPPTLPSSHQPRNFVKLTDQYNNNSNGHDLTIRSFSSGVNYGGWLIRSNWGGSLRLASTQNAFAEANSFPASWVSITPTTMDMVGLTFNAVGITASANVNLDSGTLFTDAVNNRVGIGTTNPLTALDVRGNISASNGAFNSLTTTQSIADTTGTGGVIRVLNPGGGAFSNNTSSAVGAIKIKLPTGTFKSVTMMRMTIKIFNYSGNDNGTSRTIEVGGYNYNDAGANWINYFATQSTMGGDDINVRFGNDGDTNCIWIGNTDTVWSYPKVYITEFQAGHNLFNQATWGSGWTVSLVSAFDTVTQGPIIAAKPLTSQNYSAYVTAAAGANNANFLQGRTWATPFAIGSTVANTGAFTTLTASGNVNFDSGVFVTDAAANRVGVGTTSPTTRFHVGTKVSDDNGYAYDGNTAMIVHQQPTSTTVLNDPKETLLLARQGTSGQAYGAAASFDLSRYENNGVNSRTRLDFKLAHGSFLSSPTVAMTMLSSGNIGIGRTAPAYKLDVNGDARVAGYTIGVDGSANIKYLFTNDGGASFINSGNFGIGTSTPSSPLMFGKAVYGAPSSEDFYRIKFEDVGGTANDVGIGQPVSGSMGVNVLASSGYFSISAGTDGEKMRVRFDGNVGIGSTNPQSTLDLGDGTAGKGITWAGTAGASRYATIFTPFSTSGIVLGSGFHGNTSSDAYVTSFTGTYHHSGIRLNNFGSQGIQFFTDPSASRTAGAAYTPSERMRITPAGDVGIGTTSPTPYSGYTTLEIDNATNGGILSVKKAGSVVGYLNGVSGLLLLAQNNDLKLTTTGANAMLFSTNSTERMRIASDGNIGVATTPSAWDSTYKALEIRTGAIYDTPTGTASGFTFNAYYNGTNWVYKGTGGNATAMRYEQIGGQHRWFTAPNGAGGNAITFTQMMTLDGSGNLGIGTGTPSGILDVRASNANSINSYILNSAAYGAANTAASILNLGKVESGTVQVMGAVYAAPTTNTNSSEGFLSFYTRSSQTLSERVRIHNTGNVSIGSATARTNLDVVGDIWTDWNDRFIGTVFSTGTNYRLGIKTVVNNRDTQIWSQSADAANVSGITFHTGTGPTERMRVSSSGNLGVGTTSPQYRLDVNNAATSSNTFQASFGTTFSAGFWSGIHFGYSEANNTSYRKSAIIFERQDSSARGKIHILNNDGASTASASLSDSKMTIQYDGNVGIGTQSPSYKLEVNGSFAATTKSFVINHPTKEGMKLRYGSLEGPENGVYVRGKLKGSNTIELPDYWSGLVHEDSITVNLTPIGKHQKLYVEDVSIDQIIVGNDNLLSKEINCFYTVYAERKDVERLEVEIKGN